MVKSFRKYLKSLGGSKGQKESSPSKDPPTYNESQPAFQPPPPASTSKKSKKKRDSAIDVSQPVLPQKSNLDIFIEDLAHRELGEVQESKLADRYADTGSWLVETDEYTQWWYGNESAMLWCHGKPGVGKSIFAALIVDDLQKRVASTLTESQLPKERSKNLALSYAFFNYRFSGPLEPLHLVQSILYQVFSHSQGPPPYALVELSEKPKPTLDEYVNALKEVASEFDEIIILLDALDECAPESLAIILDTIQTLLAHDTCQFKVLFTSRVAAPIEDFFGAIPEHVRKAKLEVFARKADIRAYVEHVVTEDTRKRKQATHHWVDKERLEENRRNAIDVLADKAGGVFLWAKLQAAQLLKQSGSAIPAFLQQMPLSKDMAFTYLRITRELHRLPANEREMARKLILWLVHSNGTTNFRSEVLVDIAMPWEDHLVVPAYSRKYPVRRLLEQLVKFNDEGMTNMGPVDWLHFSAKEFFKSKPTVNDSSEPLDSILDFFPTQTAADMEIGKHALRYVNTTLGAKASSILDAFIFFPLEHPLIWYCCQYFDTHLRRAQHLVAKDAECKQFLNDFIEADNAPKIIFMKLRAFEGWEDMLRVDNFSKFKPELISRDTLARITGVDDLLRPDYEPIEDVDPTQLYKTDGWSLKHAVLANDEVLVNRVLDNTPDKYIKRIDSRGASALYYAARSGSFEICERLLIDGRIGVDDGEPASSPLQAAAYNGHRQVVQLLVDHGANVGYVGGLHNSVLQAAAANGHLAIVAYLLKKKLPTDLDLNTHRPTTSNSCCALTAAIRSNDEATVEYLLQHGANPNLEPVSQDDGLPLQDAAEKGNVDIVWSLLNHGADPNAVSTTSEMGTAFNAAAFRNQIDIMKVLLELGADIQKTAGTYGTPLAAALGMGHKEASMFLLDRGASVTAKGGKWGTILKAAVTGGNLDLVKEIFARDPTVDVNAKPGYYKSALVAAAKDGSLEMVKLLVEKGARLNTRDNFSYGTALDQAAYTDKPDLIAYLLSQGAEIGTSLIEGAGRGTQTIQAFLNAGADVNRTSKHANYHSALQAAGWGANAEGIELLLSHGADPNATGGIYGNSLTAAIHSSHGKIDCIKLLLDGGANINSVEGKYGTPLQAACHYIHEEVVEYLLARGADVNAIVPWQSYSTAIQVAVSKGYGRIVDKLLKAGAKSEVGGKKGTALYIAAKKRSEELVKILLQAGANPNLGEGCPGNKSPFELAKKGGDEIILEILEKAGGKVLKKGVVKDEDDEEDDNESGEWEDEEDGEEWSDDDDIPDFLRS